MSVNAGLWTVCISYLGAQDCENWNDLLSSDTNSAAIEKLDVARAGVCVGAAFALFYSFLLMVQLCQSRKWSCCCRVLFTVLAGACVVAAWAQPCVCVPGRAWSTCGRAL